MKAIDKLSVDFYKNNKRHDIRIKWQSNIYVHIYVFAKAEKKTMQKHTDADADDGDDDDDNDNDDYNIPNDHC